MRSNAHRKNLKVLSGFLSCLFLIVLLTGCKTNKDDQPIFSSGIEAGAVPWTHGHFDEGHDQFSFAVISDLYGGERPGVVEVAVQQLNLLRPEFVLTVGDLIDGGTEDRSQLHREWSDFRAKISPLRAPLFFVGGNHDLTNLVMRQDWADRYGSRYYHFLYKDVLFLILDSEDYSEERMQEIYVARAEAIKILDGDNPSAAVESQYFKMPERRTGEISAEQSKYFKNIIDRHKDVRWTFILMHKPVWMRNDDSGLNLIEEALSDRPYTVINGHFHTYGHTLRNERDYLTLGTTGGSQNDQSNMAFDHINLVTMTKEGPSIAVLKLEGILDQYGQIPANGDTLCFQASKCKTTH